MLKVHEDTMEVLSLMLAEGVLSLKLCLLCLLRFAMQLCSKVLRSQMAKASARLMNLLVQAVASGNRKPE